MNPKVKEYISKQKSPQKEIINKLRRLFAKIFSDPQEEYRWGVIAYRGGKFYLAGLKNRVHIGFAITGLSPKEIDQFEGSGKTMRHLKISSVDQIDQSKLIRLIKLVDQKAHCSDHS